MTWERPIAGIFVGIGAICLIWKGEYAIAAGLLGAMVGFFTGEANGARNAIKEIKSSG